MTVGTFIQVYTDGGELIACVNGVVTARIPNGLEDRLTCIPFVNVIAGLPENICAIETLDDKDVQYHWRSRLIGIVTVVTHHCEVNIVQFRVKQSLVGGTGVERMLEPQGMADFMNERQVVVSPFARVRIVGLRTDPDITGGRVVGRKIGPGRRLVIH